jgi:uncharacterized protein (UPF0335 family)
MSLQLDAYLTARASGSSVEHACEQSGIGLGEARLHEKAIESGELALPHVRAPARAPTREEGFMARDNETTTTMSINGGPEMPLNLDNIDDPANAEARAAIAASVARATGGTVAADQLRLFIERIERLAEERKGIADDISEVYSEAKSMGYDKPTMRRIIRLRAMDANARAEAAALLETYANALGLQGALPL